MIVDTTARTCAAGIDAAKVLTSAAVYVNKIVGGLLRADKSTHKKYLVCLEDSIKAMIYYNSNFVNSEKGFYGFAENELNKQQLYANISLFVYLRVFK